VASLAQVADNGGETPPDNLAAQLEQRLRRCTFISGDEPLQARKPQRARAKRANAATEHRVYFIDAAAR
jgi:hypothetical protein